VEKSTPFDENLQKVVQIWGYELPTNLQNFVQKDLTEVKIFQKVWGYFFETPCISVSLCITTKVAANFIRTDDLAEPYLLTDCSQLGL